MPTHRVSKAFFIMRYSTERRKFWDKVLSRQNNLSLVPSQFVKKFHITRQRVSQILKARNISLPHIKKGYKKCKGCRKKFKVSPCMQEFHSIKCQKNYFLKKSRKGKPFYHRQCKNCEEKFAIRKRSAFCSRKCRKAYECKHNKIAFRTRLLHTFEYRQWRSDVFTRDDFICQKCNIRGGELHAHHIKPFAKIKSENNIRTIKQTIRCKEVWNINNGVTLCEKCHWKIHSKKNDKIRDFL